MKTNLHETFTHTRPRSCLRLGYVRVGVPSRRTFNLTLDRTRVLEGTHKCAHVGSALHGVISVHLFYLMHKCMRWVMTHVRRFVGLKTCCFELCMFSTTRLWLPSTITLSHVPHTHTHYVVQSPTDWRAYVRMWTIKSSHQKPLPHSPTHTHSHARNVMWCNKICHIFCGLFQRLIFFLGGRWTC